GLDQQQVEGVVQDDVLFRREVAEEGAGRDLGRLGDLFHRRLGVALIPEQPEGDVLEHGPRLELLPLAKSDSRSVSLEQRAHLLLLPAATGPWPSASSGPGEMPASTRYRRPRSARSPAARYPCRPRTPNGPNRPAPTNRAAGRRPGRRRRSAERRPRRLPAVRPG